MAYLNQVIMAELPAIFLLVVGLVLVIVEMYIPGFGAPGIIGIVCLIAGIALFADNPLEALVVAIIVVALLCVALSVSIHSVSKGRLARSHLVLSDVTQPGELGERDLSFFVGHEGTTKTVLRPSGMGEFDGVKLNIVSDGEFIAQGARVRIDRVEGNRIVVTQVEVGA